MDRNYVTLMKALIDHGADPAIAEQRAQATLFGIVQRHAAMLSFVQVFRFMGVLFIIMIPLIFLFTRPKMGRPSMGAH